MPIDLKLKPLACVGQNTIGLADFKKRTLKITIEETFKVVEIYMFDR